MLPLQATLRRRPPGYPSLAAFAICGPLSSHAGDMGDAFGLKGYAGGPHDPLVSVSFALCVTLLQPVLVAEIKRQELLRRVVLS